MLLTCITANKSLHVFSILLCLHPEDNSANPAGEHVPLPPSRALAKRLLPARCHTSAGRGGITRCGPALTGMLPLHLALLLPPSLSSEGKGKGRSSKPRSTAVATMTYKKLLISCLTHTDVMFVRGILLLGQKLGSMISPGTAGISSCLQAMESDSPVFGELSRKPAFRSWRQVEEIKESLKIVIA